MSAERGRFDGAGSHVPRPRLSVVVIVHRMPRQALNTLYTLSPAYQREISEADYEVVVVENESDRNLSEEQVLSLGANFRYTRHPEAGVSPARAINLGLSFCRAPFVGLMIDGARMVTPRVVRYALDAYAMDPGALAIVPGYLIGRGELQLKTGEPGDETAEQELMATVDWRSDGYRLFQIARLGEDNPRGYFHPILASNGLFAARERFERIGDVDERFRLAGGGALNMHLYRKLGLLPGARLVVLAGEGTFYQSHGGVSTSGGEYRAGVLDEAAREIQELWNGEFRALEMEPVLLGAIPGPAMTFVEFSAARGRLRFARRAGRADRPEWLDDPQRPGGR